MRRRVLVWGAVCTSGSPVVGTRCAPDRCLKHAVPGLQVLKAMESAVFCIVLPGDAQSTRRLSEVFMGGSIPVFIGPPYHSMPFADFIDYR